MNGHIADCTGSVRQQQATRLGLINMKKRSLMRGSGSMIKCKHCGHSVVTAAGRWWHIDAPSNVIYCANVGQYVLWPNGKAATPDYWRYFYESIH